MLGGNSEANTQGGQANAEGSDKKEEASSKDEIKDLYIARLATRELETLNIPSYTQRQEDSKNPPAWWTACWSPIQRVSWFHVSQKSGAAKMAV